MKQQRSLRTWMLIGIVGLVLIPYIGTFTLVMITLAFEPKGAHGPATIDPVSRQVVISYVESQGDRWLDPTFQNEMTARVREVALGLRLYSPEQRLIFAAGEQIGAPTIRLVTVYTGDREAGEAVWHDENLIPDVVDQRFRTIQNIIIGWVGIPLLIIGTIALAIWLASRAVLRPLNALSEAAGKINRGELDFAIPTSPVREVNQFAFAFDRMRSGLKESLERQAAMEQERRMFIAAMAHDLRTPLSSVRGYLEGIRDGVASTPEKQERYISVALEKTGSLERLIESLFAFAKTEYLEQPPQMEPLVLGELLEGAVSGLRPRAEAKGVTLRLDDGPEPCQIQGDALLLARVIDNLLDNAIRLTPGGGEVTVGWRHGVEKCRFWVQDAGPGISPEDLGQVFQPLYRGDKARGSRTGGAGLGLAIAQRLVEAHGGQIRVENRGGARFTVTLPVR